MINELVYMLVRILLGIVIGVIATVLLMIFRVYAGGSISENMEVNENFTVANPYNFWGLFLFLTGDFLALIILNKAFAGTPHWMTTILIPLVIFGLCYIIRLYIKCFKITVSGKQITVKKGMSEKYSFTVSEIIRVDKETEKKMIITTPYGSFVIRKVMDGFDEMSKYISEYVDDSKKTYK